MIALSVSGVQGAEKTFTYVGDAPMVYFPTNRNETSDLAIKIENPALAGKKIKSIKAKVNVDGQTVENPKIWLSSDLLLEKNEDGLKVNAPDILSADVTIDADGWMELALASPYTMTESPVYVGYSITVPQYNKEAKSPITYSQSRHEGGFYYYSYMAAVRWMDYNESLKGVLPIYVTIEGEFGDYELTPADWDTQYPYAQVDKAFALPIHIWNTGNEAINRFSYSYKGENYSGEGEYIAREPLQPSLTDSYVVNLPFDAIDELGKMDLHIDITTADGKKNGATKSSTTLPLECRRLVPVKRTVLEEATGTWCTACTRGIAAIDELHRLYGDRFIAMAYHSGDDPMRTDSDIPFFVPHFPSAVLDRGDVIDPYFGDDASQTNHFRIEPMVRQTLDTPAVASVNVESEWADADQNTIKAKVTLEYVQPLGGKTNSVSIAVLANGLTGEEPFWWQHNTFGHGEGKAPGILEWLSDAGNPIKNMTFDHVVVYSYEADNKAVPSNLEAFTPTTLDFTIDLSKAVSVYKETKGEPVIQNKEKIDIVALLLDEKGRVLNANLAPIGTDSKANEANGVVAPEAGEIIGVEYYDLTGRKLHNPERGIVVRRILLDNGTSITEKIIVK